MAQPKKRKKRVIKRSKGKGRKLYFDINTHYAIEKYQKTETLEEQEIIYVKEILPAFDKLAENLIFMHGFAKQVPFEGLKNDCVAFLYETLGKFDPSRGSKAFSYFNVVAKNWLIIQSKKQAKINRRQVSLEDILFLSREDVTAIESYNAIPPQDEKIIKEESMQDLFKMMDKIKTRLSGENEIACMTAIITLFRKIDDLDLLNKRAIFVYMRDLSNLNPKQLSVAMSVIRKHYKDLSRSDEFDIFF